MNVCMYVCTIDQELTSSWSAG